MSAMWRGRLERFSPLRCKASRSMEYMSPTNSRRLASSMSRNVSSSLADSPARFFPGLGLADGAGIRVPPGTSGGRAGLPFDGLGALALTAVADFPDTGAGVLAIGAGLATGAGFAPLPGSLATTVTLAPL